MTVKRTLFSRSTAFFTAFALAFMTLLIFPAGRAVADDVVYNEDGVGFSAEFSSVKLNGVELEDGMTVQDGDKLEAVLRWQLNNEGFEGDGFEYDLNLDHVKLLSTSGDIKKGNEIVGSYVIEDGKIIITGLTPGFLSESDRIIDIAFDFQVVLAPDGSDDGEDVHIQIVDKEYNVKGEYPPTKLEVSKSLHADASNNWNTYPRVDENGDIWQEYEITVTAVGEVTDIKLEDVWGDSFEEAELIGAQVIRSDGSTEDLDVTLDDNGNGFDVDFPDITLSDGDKIKLVYKARLNEDAVEDAIEDGVESGSSYITMQADADTNTAYVTGKDFRGDDVTADDSQAIGQIVVPELRKEGIYNEDNTVTWTIKLTPNMYEKWIDQNGFDIIAEQLGFGFTGTAGNFDCYDFEKIGDSYVYEFTVQADDMFGEGGEFENFEFEFVNDVTIEIDGISYTARGTALKDGIGILDKSFLEEITDGELRMSWQVDIVVMPDDGYTKAVIKDTTGPNHEIVADTVMINGESIDSIEGITITKESPLEIDITDYINTSGLKDGGRITMTYETRPVKESGEYDENGFDKSVDYSYENTTEVTLEGVKIKMTGKGSDKNSHKVRNYVEKTGISNTSFDTNGDRLEWRIWFVMDPETMKAGTEITLKDTLPEHTEIYAEGDYAVGYYYSDNKDSFNENDRLQSESPAAASGTYDFKYTLTAEDMERAAQNVEAGGTSYICVRYYTRVKDKEWFAEQFNDMWMPVEFENSVSAYYDGEFGGESSATADIYTVSTRLLEKKHTYSADGNPMVTDDGKVNVQYTVTINSNAFDLSSGDTIEVVDRMGSHLELLMDTIEVIDTSVGWPIIYLEKDKDWFMAYDPATGTTTFTFPDETPITLTYWASVKGNVGDEFSEKPAGSLDNTVSIKGYGNADKNDPLPTSGKVLGTSGSASSSTRKLTVVKFYNEGNRMKLLPGAEFRLVQVNYTADGFVETENVKTGVSGADGKVHFTGLLKDNFYKLTETAAPEGYVRDTAEHYFIFSGFDTGKVTIPDGVNVDIRTADTDWYILNKPVEKTADKYTLTIEKHWLDEKTSAQVLPTNITGIEVKLFYGDDEAPVETLELKAANSWKAVTKEFSEDEYPDKELFRAEETVKRDVTLGYSFLDTSYTNGTIIINNAYTTTETTPEPEEPKVETQDIKLVKTYEDTDLASMPKAERDALLYATNFKLTNRLTNQSIGAYPVWDDEKGAVVTFTNPSDPRAEAFLTPGSTYTLEETGSPKGYEKSNIVYICKISDKGAVTYSADGINFTEKFPQMENLMKKTTVKISKKAVTESGSVSSEELVGAKLTLTDSDGNVVDEWVSGSTPHEVTLKPGTYTLHEEAAPDGFDVVTEITFTVTEDGKIIMSGANTSGESELGPDGKTIIVKDKKIGEAPETPSVPETPAVPGLPLEPTDNSVPKDWTPVPSIFPAEDVGAGEGMTAEAESDSSNTVIIAFALIAAAAAAGKAMKRSRRNTK